MIKGIDRMDLAHKLGATFKYQQKVLASKARFRTIRKPRQAGMTTALAIESLIDAIIYDNYVICIVSPTQRQSSHMMRYIKRALLTLENILKTNIPTSKFTSQEVIFHHGSEIYSLPNNPLGIQGIACNDAKIDEGGLFAQQEGEAIIDAIVGSLAAKQGRMVISGKPHGRRGLLWQYWDPTQPRYDEFEHFTITWKDRAKEDPAYGKEVERHRKILSKLQFAETYDAEFVDEGILVYPHELLESAIKLWEIKKFILMSPDGYPQTPTNKYIGIDFGRKRNLTEIHVLEKVNETGLLRTLMMKTLANTNFEDQKKYIDGLIARVRPLQVRIDERGMGLPLLDYLTRTHGTTVQPLKLLGSASKEKVIIQLRNAFGDLKLAIPPNEDLYNQLHAFQKEYTDAGNVKYSGKVDETDFKDDKVIALAAAVDAATSQIFSFSLA